MDIFLMDAILKGKILERGKVLDLGCGEGRNGVYFIQNEYPYLGIDENESKIRLIEYLSKSLASSEASFDIQDIRKFKSEEKYDIVICSRVLHFANDEHDFLSMWKVIKDHATPNAVVYLAIDSAVENNLAKSIGDGKFEFPDGKRRFALTSELYEKLQKGFIEIEPLKTLIHFNKRAQSFALLQKA